MALAGFFPGASNAGVLNGFCKISCNRLAILINQRGEVPVHAQPHKIQFGNFASERLGLSGRYPIRE